MSYFFTNLLILCFPLIIIVIIKYKGDESMVTPISEIIFSGFVSKIVNNSVDTSWMKIKKVIKNKKTEHQNMESQIYNVIVNALNQVTYNEYEKNQDKIYQAAENLLLGYEKVKSDDIEIVRSGLQVLEKRFTNDVYLEFKGMIYNEISKKENVELYHAILLWLLDRKNEYDRQEIERLNQKLDEVIQILRTKEKASNVQYGDIKREIKSRTQEYADKWESNMFLNDFDKRDENAGVNVKLSEVYLEEHLPHYIWKDNDDKEPSTDLKELISEYINEKRDKMLLILGQPGIGKSTLITWIVANFVSKKDDILVYQFASDLRNIDWNCTTENYMYWTEILKELELTYDKIDGKILIFDGFDEISVRINRIDILNKLLSREIKGLHSKFSLIITCRENCIYGLNRIKYNYITLKPWNIKQIESFCKIYSDRVKCTISKKTMENIVKNWEILGIPLILYMVLALNISIEKEGSIVGVYDKIFALDGGIYDRCINNKNFADKHRIAEIKGQIHQISRDIAIWMFENNSEKAYIPKGMYQKICDNVMQKQEQKNEDIQHDFLIGNYFKLVKHCEGIETEQLYFVHRTIYEYFVAETIINDIENALNTSKESVASVLGKLLKSNRLSILQLDYLKYRILKSRLNDKFDYIYGSFILMIENGMTYYTKKFYKNIIERESTVFVNMLDIMHLWDNIHLKLEVSICDYLVCNIQEKVNLSNAILNHTYDYDGIKILRGVSLKRAYLPNADLRGADLRQVNFTSANLEHADLRKASLRRTDFRYANLRGADLREAQVDWIDLSSAELRETIFNDYQIDYLKEYYNLHGTKVYLETGEIIKYEEYCNEEG